MTISSRTLSCSIELPQHFRANDILTYYRRDTINIAERVEGNLFRKGLAWNTQPACLTVRFLEKFAEAELVIDGIRDHRDDMSTLSAMVRRMLGLTQAIDEFEQQYRTHLLLGPVVAKQSGLRVPVAATPFEALSWAIMGQQISVNAAISLRRKLIQVSDLKHSSGLYCYPDANLLAKLTEQEVRWTGLSQSKAQCLLALSRTILAQQLPLDDWATELPPVTFIRDQLMRIRGIGPWTINYTLLRGFGWLDGPLHGDAAVRRRLQFLLGRSEKISVVETERWLSPFSPWRALVAAHLWAFNAATINEI